MGQPVLSLLPAWARSVGLLEGPDGGAVFGVATFSYASAELSLDNI